jgi:hypothetical protein
MSTTAQDGPWKRGARLVPVPIGRIHGDLSLCDYRLAPIVRGKVYCLHVDTAEPAECDFSPASGCWLEADQGTYAAVGQIISRDGEPEGPYSQYVVAARIGDDLTVPCISPSLVPGVPIGCELGGAAVLETAGSASNATGQPLQHHCHLQVCTTSSPHPDGADPVGSADGPIFCYAGRGAALNDIFGHEADERRVYLPGTRFVHVVWSSGFEVPGAKRPATRAGWPPAINPNSPIVWRPVYRYLKIGSELQAAGGCP